MIKLVQVQIAIWDKTKDCEVDGLDLQIGDKVIFKMDSGTDVGRVISFSEVSAEQAEKIEDLQPVVRKVTTEDLNTTIQQDRQQPEIIAYCKKSVDRYSLPMKIIDVHVSFDNSRLVFPFIADGRIDFRDLVKDLTHHFQKSIRLQQIGIRDEAKISGDYGTCGRGLCCKNYLDLKKLGSITSELADLQKISHRGSNRLTGQCGRLRCCLAYEKEAYQQAAAELPVIGSTIKTPQGSGKVISHNTLKGSVNVALKNEPGNMIEVNIKKQSR